MKRIQDSLYQIALVIFLEALNTIHRRRFNSSDQQSIESCETWRNLYYYNCSCIYYWHFTGLVNLIYTTFSWELNSVGYCEAVLIRRTLTLTWRGPSSTPYLWGNKSKLRKGLILWFHLSPSLHCKFLKSFVIFEMSRKIYLTGHIGNKTCRVILKKHYQIIIISIRCLKYLGLYLKGHSIIKLNISTEFTTNLNDIL